jgi:hypothetical protein
MGLNDVLDDCQSQAGTTEGAATGCIDAVETFKQSRQMFFGDALTTVLNLDHDLLTLLPTLNGHKISTFAVFDGVVDQVYDGLFKQGAVDVCYDLL